MHLHFAGSHILVLVLAYGRTCAAHERQKQENNDITQNRLSLAWSQRIDSGKGPRLVRAQYGISYPYAAGLAGISSSSAASYMRKIYARDELLLRQTAPEDESTKQDKVRVALIYSGRWFGSAGQHFVRNHLAHLLWPNQMVVRFSIFVVVSHKQWCTHNAQAMSSETGTYRQRDQAEALLKQEVQAAFGTEFEIHVALVPDPYYNGALLYRLAQAASRAVGHNLASATSLKELVNWHRQFEAVARGEELRRVYGRHDLIVRMRIDVRFEQPVTLLDMHKALVLNPMQAFCTWSGVRAGSFSPQWREWMVVLSPSSMAVMATMTSMGLVYANLSRRCFGLCSEEQTMLHLEAAGVHLAQLPWNLSLSRIYHYAPQETKLMHKARLATLRSDDKKMQDCHLTGNPNGFVAAGFSQYQIGHFS
eukprot:CAMPEP_0119315066 /NCGR_PEP_ID=MMETSP1333-20130426/34354_1 /TAXON_ID=418940 /ORGANISM="Scyphosphaera apsteinii, Strain RCC1455" /LENGTH=420 /DNA_ID=CAMNT_0007320295 /DNA_START=68 /DNA_END=1327 /DNA_ORIENTATION=+